MKPLRRSGRIRRGQETETEWDTRCGKNVPREAERTQPSGKKGVHKTEVQAVRWCSQDRDRRRRPIQKKGAGLKPGTTKEKSTARNGCATKTKTEKILELLELGVAFDEFFGAAAGKGDGEAAVFVIAFNGNDCADTELRMANFSAEQGIGVGAAANCGAAESWRRRPTLRLARGGLLAFANAAEKFIGGVGVFGVGFVTTGFADFGHGAANGVDQFAGNYRSKTRS